MDGQNGPKFVCPSFAFRNCDLPNCLSYVKFYTKANQDIRSVHETVSLRALISFQRELSILSEKKSVESEQAYNRTRLMPFRPLFPCVPWSRGTNNITLK